MRKHLAGWGRRTFAAMTLLLAVLWLTGLVMYGWPMEALLEMSPAEMLMRRISGVVHGVLTWAFCVMVGRAVWPHVRVMWPRRHKTAQWSWGVCNGVWLLALALGGLCLLYGSLEWHEWMSPVHFWLGVFSPLLYLAHTWRRF